MSRIGSQQASVSVWNFPSVLEGKVKLDYIYSIIGKLPQSMKRSLVEPPFFPQPSKYIQEGSVMRQIKKKDVLLSYPYESMDPFLRLIKEASVDPNVMTIKITSYPTIIKSFYVTFTFFIMIFVHSI